MGHGFDTIRSEKYRLYINSNFRNNKLEHTLLKGEKKLAENFQLTPIRASKFARVYKFSTSFDGIVKTVYYKKYLYRSTWDFIKHIFRLSRAQRSFNASLMLIENGFDCPTVIAIGKSTPFFSRKENFLVTLEVQDATQIYQLIPSELETFSCKQLQEKRDLIRKFGKKIGVLHSKEIFHGDLRVGNVLARQHDSKWQFFFIDNERTKKFHKLPKRLRLKNLVQLNMHFQGISNTDRLRFIREYFNRNNLNKKQQLNLISKVLKKTEYRLKKKIG